MADTDNVVAITTPTAKPFPTLAEGIAKALEDLAVRVRKGQIFGFSLVWHGGPVLTLIKTPETAPAGTDGLSLDDVPVPDANDPVVKRRQEVEAYYDGFFRALATAKQWSPKVGDRVKEELPEVWKAISETGVLADAAGHSYADGEEPDPKVYQGAIDAMGAAWKEAFAKIAEKDQANGSAGAHGAEGPPEDYAF